MIDGKNSSRLLGETTRPTRRPATVVAQKLVDAKVNGVVGHLNSGTTILPRRSISRRGDSAGLAFGHQPDLYATGIQTTFRVMANDVQQGKCWADFG